MDATTPLLDAWLHRGEPGFAGRTALATRTRDGWNEVSYSDLDRSSCRVAVWLAARGIGAGDRVAIVGQAGPDWVIALFGVWRRGAIAVPLDARLGAGELGHIVDKARPCAVLGSAPRDGVESASFLRFDHIVDLPDGPNADTARAAGDPALVVWTSGTSGLPKGVTLSFANIAYVVDQGLAAHGLDGDDRWVSVLPLNHMLELSCALLPALATGASVAFAGTAAPRHVVNAMAERRCTRMTVVPSLLTALLADIDTTSTGPLHDRPRFHCGGAHLDPAVARYVERLGISVYTGYGLTETAPTVTMNTPSACRHGTVGRPLPGTEVRIGTDGEILVRSPGVMVGYWNDVELTRSVIDGAGWLHTGDLGHLDAHGFLHVTGRAKSLIVLANGKKVQPEEVEQALAPSVLLAEVCVLGRALPEGNEEVCAVVVASSWLRARCPMAAALTEAAATEVARLTSGLAAFKRPVTVRVIDGELPRTPKGSIRRPEVARLVWDGVPG